MRSMILRCAVLIAALSLAAACGGGDSSGGTPPAACTQTGNMSLYTSASMSTLMTGITVTAQYNSVATPVPVYVGYLTPPVEVILAGYPADGVDPLNYGIDIVKIGLDTDNPLRFNATFNTGRVNATYQAVLRFVATDRTMSGPLGCTDLPVKFTVN
jgi:hypothetical protein